MRHIALLAIVIAVLAGPAGAQYVDQALPDPALEQRALQLNKDIRCLVCQNQAISDSNATLARQLRTIVRERVAAGDS
ncbi:MAG: cytochrome c-type biogenesis protein, partial [Rhodospirillaceae bacterium]